MGPDVTGTPGTLTVPAGAATVAKNQCVDFAFAAGDVIASDFVLLKGPVTAGWQATIVSTASASVSVRLCNNTNAAASPASLAMDYMVVK